MSESHGSADDAIARVREVFDDWARRGRAEGMERGHGPSARQALERLQLGRDTWYLDVGCGNGYTVRIVAPVVAWAVGLDVSGEMIARAHETAGDLDNVEFVQAAFPRHTLPEKRFDAIFSMEVFYYLPDLDAGLAAVARLLRPGGRFACVVDHYEENVASHSWAADLGVAITRLDAAGWRAAFERNGLAVVEQARLRHDPGADVDAWKVEQGSLLTLGRRA